MKNQDKQPSLGPDFGGLTNTFAEVSFREKTDGPDIGRFFIQDGELHFEGNATDSATRFVNELKCLYGETLRRPLTPSKEELDAVLPGMGFQQQSLVLNIINKANGAIDLNAAKEIVDDYLASTNPVEQEKDLDDDPRHVDNWIDDYTSNSDKNYAKFVLNYFRMPAVMQAMFRDTMSQHELYCTYKGKRYRVTMASRMGDLGLSSDSKRACGYDVRGVYPDECTNWSKTYK